MICRHCNQQLDQWGEHPRSCVRINRFDPEKPRGNASSYRSRILNAVSRDRSTPSSPMAVANELSLTSSAVGMAMAELCREKRIVRVGHGRYVRAA